jgi:hypothetical protein
MNEEIKVIKSHFLLLFYIRALPACALSGDDDFAIVSEMES